ncbi:MAG: hypothetical protein OET90_01860, partial [Desulfuromonadales bacterium]|nr:hypothetical protein [Desulfuromonadales bacterium]
MGTVKTLAATGAKASGGTSKTDMNTLVKNLVAIKPVQTVGVVYSKGEAGSEQQLEELQALAQKYGFAVKEQNVRNAKEALSLSKKLAKGCDALFLTESISVGQNAQAIVAAVQANKCLVFSQIPGLVAEGAVLGLEADLAEQGAIVAVYALQVLQGQQVQLFPVKEAKKISLKVNAQAAAALGLTIPTTVASQAKMM